MSIKVLGARGRTYLGAGLDLILRDEGAVGHSATSYRPPTDTHHCLGRIPLAALPTTRVILRIVRNIRELATRMRYLGEGTRRTRTGYTSSKRWASKV